jgi:hypothetical protein
MTANAVEMKTDTIGTNKVGLLMFWVGAVIVFTGGWLAMWWIFPIWANSPVEQFEGTILAFEGPVYMLIGLSTPLGIALAAIGILLCAESKKARLWPFAIGIVLIVLGMLTLPTLGYYPVLFGISGGFILLLFFATLWYWAKKRSTLEGTARTAADFQLVSYVFFLFVAMLMCMLLGNPFSGLYFPEKVRLFDWALPAAYSMGAKAAIYLALGFLFTFLSHYKAAQAEAKTNYLR